MKNNDIHRVKSLCMAYEDLVAKITEAVEVARDCHQMSGIGMEAASYKLAAAHILHDIVELTGVEG